MQACTFGERSLCCGTTGLLVTKGVAIAIITTAGYAATAYFGTAVLRYRNYGVEQP